MNEPKTPGWFDDQDPARDEDFKRRKALILEDLPGLLKERARRDEKHRQGRADNFLPYLLLRSVLSDRGNRPINTAFWESPDIWTAPGKPEDAPEIPPGHGGTVVVGQPNTVYAHVWNLGFAPLAGIQVEFYWFNPSLGIDGTHANRIGVARCELAGRGMDGSHKLVKCPTAWTPVMENNGHECLVVRVSGIGDPIGGNAWKPWLNRHVAQRNLSVVSAGTNVQHLISRLELSRLPMTRLQLVQLGRREARLAAHIAAPKLQVADIATHVLGEISSDHRISVGAPHAVPAAMMAAIHPLAAEGPPPAPRILPHGTAIIDPMKSIAALQHIGPGAIKPKVAGSPSLQDLMKNIVKMHAGAKIHDPPAAGHAHVVRIASYSGDQLIGGYTLVVTA